MSSDKVAIRLRGVSKQYKIFASPAQQIRHMFLPSRSTNCRTVDALKPIDLEMYRGETVGIVGSNGAGKSTLLQIICGILRPDAGTVEVNGRISALLELGASFNPMFSGIENIKINGMLLGLSPADIKRKMDDILAFADIGDFVYQPVRTYSSGMFARLAFSVASHLDPDILIIDEALAVGDEAFQRKCFSQLEKLKERGATILFVSHSARAVTELCDRAILLFKGECLLTADAKTVIEQYQRLIYAAPNEHAQILAGIREGTLSTPQETAGGGEKAEEDAGDGTEEWFDRGLTSESIAPYISRGAKIHDWRIETPSGKVVNVIKSGREYVFRYKVEFDVAADDVRFSMMVKTVNGVGLGAQWTAPMGRGISVDPGTVVEVELPFVAIFTGGSYFVNAGVHGIVAEERIVMHRILDAYIFRVNEDTPRRTDYYVDITSSAPRMTNVEAAAKSFG